MAATCLATEDGASWAKREHVARQDPTTIISVSFRGQAISVPVLLSQPVAGAVELLCDAFSGFEPDFVKVLCRGKKLSLDEPLGSQGVKAGSKLMVLASSAAEVERVRLAKSDPTVRGFEGEKRLEKGRLRDPAASSPWRAEQDPTYKFGKFEVVAFEPPVAPHPFEAEKMLRKLATDPGVVAVMREHKFYVGKVKRGPAVVGCEHCHAECKQREQRAWEYSAAPAD